MTSSKAPSKKTVVKETASSNDEKKARQKRASKKRLAKKRADKVVDKMQSVLVGLGAEKKVAIKAELRKIVESL